MHTSADSRSLLDRRRAHRVSTACRLPSRRVVRPGQRQGERHKRGHQACGNQHTQHTLSAAASLRNPTGVYAQEATCSMEQNLLSL